MSASERSGWRDQEISQRHRRWGFNCPAVDLDFLMLEYHRGIPVAVVDYKHYLHKEGRDLNVQHPSFFAMGALYDEHQRKLPLFVCRYWPETWAVEALAVNDAAQEWLPAGEWRSMSERSWVHGLYKLRNLRAQEGVLRNCRDDMPPVEEAVA